MDSLGIERRGYEEEEKKDKIIIGRLEGRALGDGRTNERKHLSVLAFSHIKFNQHQPGSY